METVTAAEMRAIEEAAIASGRVTGLELMERAGAGVVEAIFEEWPELSVPAAPTGRGASPSNSPGYFGQDETGGGVLRAVVLCGPGNNGGDGFVVARLLHARGWEVDVSLLGDPEKLPPDARTNFDLWSEIGDVVCLSDYADDWAWRDDALGRPNNICVDALFGTGLVRPLQGIVTALTGYIAEKRKGSFSRIVAVDIPSGLNADTGEILGHTPQDDAVREMREFGRSHSGFCAIDADLTVAFHRAKKGHVTGQGPWLCGKVVVKDIGL